MNAVRELVGFLRWRLIPVRYAGKIMRSLPGRTPRRCSPRLPKIATLNEQGWVVAPSIPEDMLRRIQAKYIHRSAAVVPVERGHPFINLFNAGDITLDDPVCQLAFSHEILDAAHDYFGGRFRFNSIQLMYSWPTDGCQQSQMWHKDYGDSRSFHWVAYLVDVLDAAGGPFVFIDKEATRCIGKSVVIRRISDVRFRGELGGHEIREFLGNAGESIFVDPSVCYHYGSRCRRPRLALFVTFSTDSPFTQPTDLIIQQRERLVETACAIRPDLSASYLRQILAA